MNEEKIEKLLEMQQHPNDYSQREWDEMLADEEVRQTLETMTLLRRAYARDDAAKEDEEMTEREWQRLRRRLDAPARHASGRIAASVAGLLLTAGLAVAAFHPGGLLRWDDEETPQTLPDGKAPASRSIAPRTQQAQGTGDEGESVTFDNQTLETMLAEMAAYYRTEVVFRSDKVRRLRFHYIWRKQPVKRLNYFEHVKITIEEGRIIVDEGK